MNLRTIKTKVAIAATIAGTLGGAFLMPTVAFASDGGDGAVYVDEPRGWQNKAVTLQVKTNDIYTTTSDGKDITYTAKCVYASIDDEKYKDITDSMVVTIDHNCQLKLKAIYDDGSTIYNDYDFKNFDLENPEIKASVDGELLYLTATDEISGVKDINANGKSFTELGNGQMCVNIKDLQATDEYIEIYADDNAGNKSKVYKVKNPYYVGEIESGQEDKSLDNPDSVEATDPTEARGTVTEDVTTTEDGEVIKEFYTVEASGKTFYLIVDKSQNQDNVYLLTEAGVNDLLNFVDYNGVDVENGDVPMYEIPSNTKSSVTVEDTTEEAAADTEEVTEETKETKSNSSAMLIIVVLACAGGIGYYIYRNKKRKEDLEEAEEMDAYDVPEDDEVLIEEGEDDEYEDEDTADAEDNDDTEEDADHTDEVTEEDIAGADIMPADLEVLDDDFEEIRFDDPKDDTEE